MKLANRFLALVAWATLLPLGSIVAQSDGSVEIKGNSELSIDRIFASGDFAEESPGRIIPGDFDGEGGFFRIEPSSDGSGQQLVHYSVSIAGKQSIAIAAKELVLPGSDKPLVVEELVFSSDRRKCLIFTASRRVWRRNTKGNYWLFDLESRELKKLGGDAAPSSMMFAKFSPDSSRIAYVRENNIYVQDLTTLSIQPVTTDGSQTVINGTSDWVYEEELDLRDAFRWSPASDAIAFWQFDTEGVREFTLSNVTDTLYPQVTTFAYPKVGQQNAAVRVGIVQLQPLSLRWIPIPGDSRDDYIARMEWNPAAGHRGELVIQQFNRLQNENRVYLVDSQSLSVDLIHCEKDQAWLENDNPIRWMDKGAALLWLSERNGWRNGYRLPLVPNSQLEPWIIGEFDIIKIEDELDLTLTPFVHFTASPGQPTEQYLYRLHHTKGADGAVTPIIDRLTSNEQKGWHSFEFLPGVPVLHSYSSFGAPPIHEIISYSYPQFQHTLTTNDKLRKKLESLAEVRHEFRSVNIGNGIELDAWVMYPPNFDPTRKYPLLMNVYGEPHGQTVRNAWGGNQYLWHRMLAEQGYIIASVDNRGTMSPRGRDWRKVVHRQIGILASAEQAAATRQLLVDIPSIDAKKIAIWGWSGGGSMSLNAIFRYPDLYNTAMAIAPVPDQKLYDTIYQERYMGLPRDNEEGYRLGSPITFAHQLKGNLLIVHGTGDDNCHYQGVERLMNVLIANNKQFTVMPYPNRSHSINEGANTTRHLFSLLAKYLKEHMPTN